MLNVRQAARVSMTSTPMCAVVGAGREQAGEILLGQRLEAFRGPAGDHVVGQQNHVLPIFARTDADPAIAAPGDDIGRGRLQVEFHRPGLIVRCGKPVNSLRL